VVESMQVLLSKAPWPDCGLAPRQEWASQSSEKRVLRSLHVKTARRFTARKSAETKRVVWCTLCKGE